VIVDGPLSFITAIDCAALATVPLDITLPRAGMLMTRIGG
jgi:hypothetical protein